jgi:hypothetical protein
MQRMHFLRKMYEFKGKYLMLEMAINFEKFFSTFYTFLHGRNIYTNKSSVKLRKVPILFAETQQALY